MQTLKSVHLLVGIFGIVVFVLTGQYMEIFLRGMIDMPDGPRLLYRTSHLYLMWSSLVNLLVGVYFVAANVKVSRLMQCFASGLLLAGPPLIIAGFFLESPANNLDRPFCGWANYFALAGVILHVFASRKTAVNTMKLGTSATAVNGPSGTNN
jgi:hypothetical protein